MPTVVHLEQMKFLPVVKAVMTQAGLNIAMDRWDVRNSGSAHVVINMGNQLSVRVAKTDRTAFLVARRTEVLRRLPTNLSFEVPRPITRVITRNGYTAIGYTWIKGEPRNPGSAPEKALATLVKEIRAVDTVGMVPYLDTQHAHWGGTDWEKTLREQVVPLLLSNNQKLARAAIDSVLALEPVEPTLVHGDLAGHNILWQGDRLAGVIDWDHTTIGDPAFDLATLGNWYGWESLSKAVTPAEIDRARVLSRLLALQAVAYTLNNGMGGAIVRLAVERADDWLRSHRDELT
ncbi:phosphotransferase [Rothia sp. ZJ932]|uniref:phosphotransferase n=1 Tax=Rothia sp. ZJ932 TaxID=2810516 RepID=UPI001968568D|nr:phosphotransferase [Rothia sp. ZJ932]QRZ62298.1 phosphotransferase [Rothia sp. ZJ932]